MLMRIPSERRSPARGARRVAPDVSPGTIRGIVQPREGRKNSAAPHGAVLPSHLVVPRLTPGATHLAPLPGLKKFDSCSSFWTRCLIIVLSCFLCPTLVSAQDDEDEDEPPPQNAQQKARLIQQQQQQKIGPEYFDQVIFSGTTERGARDKLNLLLIVRVDDIDRVAGLKPDQSQKLRLAGQMDVKRLFDQLDAARRQFDLERVDPQKSLQARRNLQPFRRLVSDQVFEKGSLFDKMARTLLTDEQRAPYQRQLQERREFRQRALRETILLALDRQMPLLSSQRDELRELLAESRPVHTGPYESQAVWFAASKLPAEKYQKILTEKQWQLLQVRFANVRNMEQFLQQNGAFDDVAFDVFVE